jgi:hypothetical protein
MTNYYESNRSLTPIKLEINRLKREKQINHTLFLTNAKLIFKGHTRGR